MTPDHRDWVWITPVWDVTQSQWVGGAWTPNETLQEENNVALSHPPPPPALLREP